ncbi:Uncharacterised protein [Segatella copri]|nr:Uncharacterised protein [Segatella copri]
MSPLRDTVSLINGIERNLYSFKELNIIFFRQRFRCNIQEFCRTIENIILHLLNSRLIQ